MPQTWDLPKAAFIRLDLFPAILRGDSFPNGVLDRQRLIVTDAYVITFADAPGGPVVTNLWELNSITGRNTTGYKIMTETGEEFVARRSNGCGCGSLLRGVRPYPDVPYDTRIEP